MKKVKAFFYHLGFSLFPQRYYYHHLITKPLEQAFRYFLSLIIFLNLIALVYLIVQINPVRINTVLNSLSVSLAQYPNDLIINIKNGSVNTTYNRPYLSFINYNDLKRLLFVVDESATPQKLAMYQSFMLLTKSSFVFSPSGNMNDAYIIPLSTLSNLTIDKNLAIIIQRNLVSISSMFTLAYFGIILALIIFLPLISTITTLLFILIASFISFLVYRFYINYKKRSHFTHFHFKKTLVIAFHAVTLPLIIDYFLLFFGLRSSYQPFIFLSLLTLFVVAGIYEAYYPEK